MKELRCTLLTDGPTDRALIPVLQWVLRQRVPFAVNIDWADLRERRVEEIEAALAAVDSWDRDRTVAVVPIRMTEAWLLIDAAALRIAAGNPRGSVALSIPAVRQLEGLPDPKKTLHDLIRRASSLGGRRLSRFRMDQAVHRLAQAIEDYSPLRDLSAFRALEEEVGGITKAKGWRR